MSHLEISNPGGIADKELGASLTGSTTLIKSSKDVLGGNKVIIDFGMHQGSENANELNKLLDNKTVDIVNFYYLLGDLEKNNKKINILILLNEKLKSKNNENNLKLIEENNEKISNLINLIINVIIKLNDLYFTLDSENLLKLFNYNRENLDIFCSELNKQKVLFSNKKEYLNNIDKNIVEGNSIYDNNSLKKLFKNNIDENLLKNYIITKNDGEDLIDADVLIITHAHMDHIGRVPQLVKAGFKGRIIMSPFTKAIAKHMWKDYINVIQRDIEKVEHGNAKIWKDYNEYLKFINNYDKLKHTNLEKKQREGYKKSINIFLKGNDVEIEYKKIKNLLDEKNIINQESIKSLIKSKVPELLYDINDVYKAFEMIETLEVGEEINLDSRIVITKSDSDVIDRIPKIIEDGYDKPIYILPYLKQKIINSWYNEYNETIEENSKNKKIKDNYTKFKKFIDSYNRTKNKGRLKIAEGYTMDEYYEYSKGELESNEKFIFENKIDEALGYKKILESSSKYDSVKNLSNEQLIEEKKNIEKEIDDMHNISIEGINFKELSLFYKENKRNIKNKKYYDIVSSFISKNNISSLDDFISFANKSTDFKELLTNIKKHSKKSQLNTIYNNYIFYVNNSNNINALENTEILFENEKKIGLLYSKSSTLKNKFKLLEDYEDYILLEKIYLKNIKILDEYNINSSSDKIEVIDGLFANKKLKYTKKQIKEAISKLRIILEKENEKVVESLKLTFYNAGHIEGSRMVSLSYITKEIKSNVNGILSHGVDSFTGHKEIKKSFKNLLFSGDIGKITQPNISGVPDIPLHKYDYTQLESTYANREHPDKQKEFNRLIEILNRPGRKLGATFALQRAQEPPVEILTLLKNNINNQKELERLYAKRRKINSEYKKYQLGEDKDKIEEKFLELSNINLKIESINKDYYSGTILLDSPSASKITDEFIKNFPEKYKILDPMIQKKIFGKEKFRVLGPGESERLYKKGKKYENFFLLSSGGMIQGGMIISHLKELVSDPNATVILFGYVAEGTLGRKLLNGDNEIIIDGEKFEVKCKIESIGGFSSHMGQGDLVNFGGNLLNYSRNAILSLTHGDETRGILKELINGVNSKVEIIIPKLGDKLKIKL